MFRIVFANTSDSRRRIHPTGKGGARLQELLMPSFRLQNYEIHTDQFIKENDATTIEFDEYFDDSMKNIERKEKNLLWLLLDNCTSSVRGYKVIVGDNEETFSASEHRGERYELLKNVFFI
ncbi:MAG: hypothetical protein U5K71_10690 [Gracilimonas sp.]|nr:hypothetical protein [Gracilimonas sp.]